MVPDFRIQLPAGVSGFGLAPGETATRLAELKYTCSEQHYRTGVRQRDFKRAVDRRAGQLMEEYRSKADRMDRMLGEEEGRGRVRRQLDTYGDLLTIVVGKFLEMSEDAHLLMAAMAESRVAKQARSYGQARLDKQVEKGVVQGEIRRQLAVVNLSASMSCLLERLHQAGEGARLGARQQERLVREEERMREERELLWAARVRGTAILQPGRIVA